MKKETLIGLSFVAAITLVPIGCWIINTATSVATAPGRVIVKTMETDNIITSYEWFYDTSAAYDARVGQIQEHQSYLTNEQESNEVQRLRIELSAMRQSCRELATKYNANSTKVNKDIFKGKNAPENLNQELCNA